MTSPILELFTIPTLQAAQDWKGLIASQQCHYLERACVKVRKSQPAIAIGTCSVRYGSKQAQEMIICPHRFLERGQVFLDCLHLLTLHEPGNELHCIGEIEIPGGSVDYFLVSARRGKVIDFVGIELQAVDTTGSLWPLRQAFLASVGVPVALENDLKESYGINWKMTAKTTLVQLHHKIATFENFGKHLVLVLQDHLLAYMRREFHFGHIQAAKLGHAMHFHSYTLQANPADYQIELAERISTDAAGIARALDLQADAKIELTTMLTVLENKLSSKTLLRL